MGKYDFDLELVGQNSLLLILEQIKKGSTVLEFGPANGRLTKYLNRSLGCKMYLVEIDEEAGKEALQYAEDLVVGDAEEYTWLERYQDIRFDYLIFADILEHLRDPRKLLATAKRLLKEDGSVIISVPNLAHNAVLINLLNNNFEYQTTGLLDNTHIHLFTKNGVENMLQQVGLYPVKKFATYNKVADCEVKASLSDVSEISKEYWNNRPYGEVYQFIYEAKKNQEFASDVENYLKKSVSATYLQVFLNGLENLSEEMSIKKQLQQYDGKNAFSISFPEPQEEIRLDPMNCNGIVKIQDMVCICGGRETGVKICTHNAEFQDGDFYFFSNEDPQLYIVSETGEAMDEIRMELEFMELGSGYVGRIIEMVSSLGARRSEKALRDQEENARIREDLLHAEAEVNRKSAEVVEKSEELLMKESALNEKDSFLKNKEEKLDERECTLMKREAEADKKDASAMQLRNEEFALEMDIKIAEVQKASKAQLRKEKLEFQRREMLYQDRIDKLEAEQQTASENVKETDDQLRIKEQYIESLKKLLVEKDRVLVEQKNAMEEKDRVIQAQDKEIQGFFSSKTWKINRIVTKILHLE